MAETSLRAPAPVLKAWNRQGAADPRQLTAEPIHGGATAVHACLVWHMALTWNSHILTPASELIVMKASGDKYTEVTRYKVGESQTYAYPVVTGDHIFIKDQDAVFLYSLK